jgi:hypothetical protein
LSGCRCLHLALLCGLQGVFAFPLFVGPERCRGLLEVVGCLFEVEEGDIVSTICLTSLVT